MNLIQMSISAGLLIVAILFLRTVALNKIPKATFLMLWGVVIVRLLVPVSIPMPYSFSSVVRKVTNTVPSYGVPMPVMERVLSVGEWTAPGLTGSVDPATQAQVANLPPTLLIWLAGMLIALTFFGMFYIKAHRKLRFATPIGDHTFINDWQKAHRLMRPIAIMQSDSINTPIAAGLIQPRIILPTAMNMDDKQLLNHVLFHEYCHIKRLDAIWKILMVVALCVHWFNPLAWMMFILANRDLELACDEMVLRHFGAETKTAYAYSIICMAEQKSTFASLYNGFSKNTAAERIESIMKLKKTSIIGIAISFVLVSALAFGALSTFATSAEQEELETPPVVEAQIRSDVRVELLDLEKNWADNEVGAYLSSLHTYLEELVLQGDISERILPFSCELPSCSQLRVYVTSASQFRLNINESFDVSSYGWTGNTREVDGVIQRELSQLRNAYILCPECNVDPDTAMVSVLWNEIWWADAPLSWLDLFD